MSSSSGRILPAGPRARLRLGWLILLLGVACAGDRNSPAEPPILCGEPPVYAGSGQMVLIKADDLMHEWGRPDRIHPRWLLFFETIRCNGIHASAGLIGRTLFTGSANYRDSLTRLYEDGYIEFFNHGFMHSLEGVDPSSGARAEFHGTPVEVQKLRLQSTQDLLEGVTGHEPAAFGAPGNAWDQCTREAVDSTPGIRFWFFGDPASKAATLTHSIRIENVETFRPELGVFRRSFKSSGEAMILQVHPAAWSQPEDWLVFQQVIDSLKATGAQFVTPTEYLKRMQFPLEREMGVGE